MSASADFTHTMGQRNIPVLSAKFGEKLREARAYLRSEMDKLGLLEAHGWRIAEVVRECEGGSELVLRPIHSKLDAPAGLECVVWFIRQPARVGAECAPAIEDAPPRRAAS